MIATQTSLEQRLQIDFTNPADPVAAELLAAAQGHIEREVGYPLEETVGIVETFDGEYQRSLFTSRRPLTAVASVTEDSIGLASTDYAFYTEGRIVRLSGGYEHRWQSGKPKSIVVTYTAGYAAASVPKDLVDVCAWLAADAFRVGANFAAVPSGADGIQRERIGDYEVEYKPRTADWPNTITWPDMFELLHRVAGYYRTLAIA